MPRWLAVSPLPMVGVSSGEVIGRQRGQFCKAFGTLDFAPDCADLPPLRPIRLGLGPMNDNSPMNAP
jgi:hypothetical protein